VKIDVNRIPPEGLTLDEVVNPAKLELDTEIVKFPQPVRVRAEVSRITNAVTATLALDGSMHLICSRCLQEFKINLKKNFRLSYQANSSQPIIDLDQDIREEIVLDYPIKPLCKPDCRGLCLKCGKNLNEGGCSCATT